MLPRLGGFYGGPVDRIVHTRFGPVPLVVDGAGEQWRARLAEPDQWPRLAAVKGAVGETAEEAVERLVAALERFGSDPAPPPPPVVTL